MSEPTPPTPDQTPTLQLTPVPVTGFDVWIWAHAHDTYHYASAHQTYEDAVKARPRASRDNRVHKRQLFKTHIQFSQLEEFFEYYKPLDPS